MVVQTVDYRSPNAAEEFAHSLHTTGFGVLQNHPIPWTMIEKAYQEWGAFFNGTDKFNYTYDPDKQDGYVSTQVAEVAKGEKIKDIKEFYHLYFPWGRYPSSISSNSRDLFELQFKLGKELLSWIERYLPEAVRNKLKEPLLETVSRERTTYRILHYPPLTGNEPKGAVRAAAHEDINLITILPTASASGLEAKDAQGNWHRVKADPHTLIVNIGDMLQEMTDFYYISTSHRVVNPEGNDAKQARMSMPLFIHAKAEAYLSKRYPTAESYLHERLVELGLRKQDMMG